MWHQQFKNWLARVWWIHYSRRSINLIAHNILILRASCNIYLCKLFDKCWFVINVTCKINLFHNAKKRCRIITLPSNFEKCSWINFIYKLKLNHEQYFNSLYAIVARVKYRNSFSIKSSQQPIWHYYDECRWCSVIYLSVMWQQMAIINKFLSRDTRKGCRKLLFFSWPVLRLFYPFHHVTIIIHVLW